MIYLLGTADNDPNHWELDKSCAGEAEGPDRYTRGVKFFRYLQGRNAAILRQRLWSAPGAGHDPEPVFGSPCGRAVLFDALGCQEGRDTAACWSALGAKPAWLSVRSPRPYPIGCSTGQIK